MEATTTCLMLVPPIACCSACAKFSSTMMASAPASLSGVSSSCAVYKGLIHCGESGVQDSADRHRILQHVRHHDGDARTLRQALLCSQAPTARDISSISP